MITKTRAWVATAFVGALIAIAVVVTALGTGPPTLGAAWIKVGSVDSLKAAGVTRVPDQWVWVVSEPTHLIALSAHSPHLGEFEHYCKSSGWFEDALGGGKFDVAGDYMLGPPPRGMDHIALKVYDGNVWVNPDEKTVGTPRGYLTPGVSHVQSGPFCI